MEDNEGFREVKSMNIGAGTMSAASRRRRRAVYAVVAVLGSTMLIFGPNAGAAPLVLPDTTYNYTVVDQDLPAALQEFGTNLGIKVNVSPEVRGRVQGRLPELKPRAFLERLASMFNFEWYYDGQVLHISAVKEAQTRLLVLAPIGFEQFKAALDVLKVADDRFAVVPAPGDGLVLVSGPPRFAALAEQTLAGLIAEQQARPKISPSSPPPRETVLNVFRGTQVSIWRNGRLEQVIGPDPRSPESQTARQSRSDDDAGRDVHVSVPASLPPAR
ncbi:nodulation protein NolW [Bradyrhizobium xenonodulans]|uniref:Nodulation protein NolW n=1 Tax=Bradyrhizobium xenonodulans TaxID=2736875 RepID=A0ABY7MSI7_9BRAD|nr:nodulation protein NolW [Bradyrhizobium xenonodulans]WBL81366.1 nodulation protein NolW [Bradyrhizobium xenonodulans]